MESMLERGQDVMFDCELSNFTFLLVKFNMIT